MLVVSDVDRTLLDPGSLETDACRELVAWLAERSFMFGIASSRSWHSVRSVLPTTSAQARFIICADGAIAFKRDATSDKVVWRAILDLTSDSLSRIEDVMSDAVTDALGACFVFLDDRHDFKVLVDNRYFHDPMVDRLVIQGRPTARLAAGIIPEDSVMSVGLLTTAKVADVVGSRIAAEMGGRVIVRVYDEVRLRDRDLWWCEVSSPSADKGDALAAVLSCISHCAPLIALVDGANDLHMAERANYVLCPPWAFDAVKQLATTRVVDSTNCETFLESVVRDYLPYLGKEI